MPKEPGEPRSEDLKRRFQFGERVFVKRSSGDTESGWIVMGYNGEDVVVHDAKHKNKKDIPEQELAELQDEKLKEIRRITGI